MKLEEFLRKAKEKYGDSIDLSLVTDENLTYNTKIKILCHKKDKFGREHGITTLDVNHLLLRGQSCNKCSGKYKRTREDFIFEATETHDGIYTYDDFEYVDMKTKGKIYCPKHGVEFYMSPQKHLAGQGCPKCRYEKSAATKTHNQEWFEDKMKVIHGDKYDLSEAVYKGYEKKVKLCCHKRDENGVEHGVFEMTPNNLFCKFRPQGCPKCGRETTINAHRDTYETFVEKANKVHKNRYSYEKVKGNYKNSQIKIEILCKKCGKYFKQEPSNHLMGQGCPFCCQSKLELEIMDFLDEKCIEYEIQKKFPELIGNRRSVDFYLPEYNAIIECQGSQHFKDEGGWNNCDKTKESDKYKNRILTKNGYRIFYYSNMSTSFKYLHIVYPYYVYENKEKLLEHIINGDNGTIIPNDIKF